MKKLFAYFVLIVLLAACGGTAEETAVSPSEASSPADTAETVEESDDAAEEDASTEAPVEEEAEAPAEEAEEATETPAEEEAEAPAEETMEESSDSAPLTAITTGIAQNIYAGEVTVECNSNDYRTGNYGELTDENGHVWMVPADVAGGFTNVDVYNDCTGSGENDYEAELETQVIDEGGEVITAYLFGDNYYEMYVNGTFAGRDAVPFTTFNSHAAQFQVEYPITYAFLLVDWEEYNGIGMEELRGSPHMGDAGFIATFSDGSMTGADWVCKAFYISPLDDGGSCLTFDENGNADSSACNSTDSSVSCVSNDPESTCNAYHEELPADWMMPDFDDSGWQAASTYTADDVTNQVGFRNYEDTLFAGADFIWTSNLVLDNNIVCRTTIDQ